MIKSVVGIVNPFLRRVKPSSYVCSQAETVKDKASRLSNLPFKESRSSSVRQPWRSSKIIREHVETIPAMIDCLKKSFNRGSPVLLKLRIHAEVSTKIFSGSTSHPF